MEILANDVPGKSGEHAGDSGARVAVEARRSEECRCRFRYEC
jgi:hypothetical protein